MRIVLQGYFGATNSGDSATLAGVVKIIDRCTNQKNKYSIMTTHRGECREVDKYITADHEFIWYDKIPADTDLFVVANSGATGGIFINPVMEAMHRNIPVIATCIKAALSKESVYYDVFKVIVPKMKMAMVRLQKNLTVWQEGGFGNVILAADFALYNDAVEYEEGTNTPPGAVIICPRLSDDASSGEPTNSFQIQWITDFISSHPDQKFIMVALSESDIEICNIFKYFDNVTISNLRHYDFSKVMYLMRKAQLVVSTGRLHAMIYALKVGVPAVLVTNKPSVAVSGNVGSDPARFISFAEEYRVPIITGKVPLKDILQISKVIDYNKLYAIQASTEMRMKQTLHMLFNKKTEAANGK